MADSSRQSSLSRSLGFWALVCYGVGDILGAGIYGLVGKVAGEAGAFVWLSFFAAMVTAGLTGLSYAEMAARHPQSAGESVYTLTAFRRPWLAFLAGWMVFCSGVVSLSAVAHACGNYVQGVWPDCPAWIVWILYVAFISAVNFRGIRQSSGVNIAFTLLEIFGLLLVIIVGVGYFFHQGAVNQIDFSGHGSFVGVMQGATIAFFAYIGFEDMINVAEEVQSPARTYPKAIIISVLVCGGIYSLVCLASLAVLSPEELARSEAPLLAVVRRAAPAVPPSLYMGIALVAVANTGLLNSIMASRLLYGMANQGLLPRWLAAVHPHTRTPHWAILTLAGIALMLIFSGTLALLASTTSLLLLLVFTLVNASLLRLRISEGRKSEHFSVPLVFPVAAIMTCVGLMFFIDRSVLWWVGGILALGIGPAILAQSRRIDVTDFEE